MHPATFWRYARLVFYIRLVLLLLLVGMCLLPVVYSQADVLSRISLQEVRSQRFAKDALLLEYQADTDQISAISEMQNMLPAWQQEENQLYAANNESIHVLMLAATPDYTSITTAVEAILAHPDTRVDPVEVDIILAHEQSYLFTMSQVVGLIGEKLDQVGDILFAVQAALIVLVAGWMAFDRYTLWPKIKFLFFSSSSLKI